MSAMRVCLSSAQYSFWRSKKFLFLVTCSWGLHFWRESKINSRCHWRCVLSRWVLSQQREMQIYRWLCNNFEIHLWLWQLWGLVVCSESSFHVTRTSKGDKNRQNTLFLLKKTLHDKQLFNKVPFQSTKYGKKELCMDNKVPETIGGVYCPTCRNEKCVYISTNKTTSFYDCQTCKACCLVLNIPFKDQKPTIMLYGGYGTLCFAKTEYSRLRRTILFFGEISPPITNKHIRTWTKKGQIKSKYGINVSVSYWLMIWTTFSFFKSFFSISLYSQLLLNLYSTYRKSSSSQSPTTESSGLSILVPTLLLLQLMISTKI